MHKTKPFQRFISTKLDHIFLIPVNEKIEQIIIKQPYQLICVFNNKEKRLLDLRDVLDETDKYAGKVFNLSTFNQVKIGELGELYWEDLAEMKNLKGELIECAYDISPDLAYMKSQPLEKELEPDY